MNTKPKSIQFTLPPATYKKLLEFARHIHCESETGRPKAASTVKQVLRTVLNFYSDETFLEQLEIEGGDTLSYIQKCVRKEVKRERQPESRQKNYSTQRGL